MQSTSPLPAETVIGDEGLVLLNGQARLAVRLPWYRSLPLSVIEIEALSVDAEMIDLDGVRFELDGQAWLLAELKDATDHFWFVLDSAFLVWPQGSLQPGRESAVSVNIAVNPPYIPGLRRSNPQTAILTVKQEA